MQVVNRYRFSSSTTEYEKNVATGTNKHREQCYKAAMERIRRECGIKDDAPTPQVTPQVTTEDRYAPIKGSLFC